MTIKGFCKTNIDEWRNKKWPESFVSVPMKGDIVISEGGIRGHVCEIRHCVAWPSETFWLSNLTPGEPYIEVELNKMHLGV